MAELMPIQEKADEQRSQRETEARQAAQLASDEAILARKFPTEASPPPQSFYANRERNRARILGTQGGRRKSRNLGTKFNRCVKSVRSTVKARKGSNKESAAIAICTTSVLYPRGRTMKRYRKGRLVTQRRRPR